MCQACQKPEENRPNSAADPETQAVIDCLNERAAENDRIINQLIIGACILEIAVAILAIICPYIN